MDAQSNSDLNLTPENETSISSDGRPLSTETRRCNPEDVEMIVAMAKKFIAYSPYKDVPIDDDYMQSLFANLLEHGTIITNGTGFICGMLTPLFFSPNVVIAAEMAWWSEGGNGQDLKRAFEDWARSKGAQAVQFSAFNNQFAPKMNELLTKSGYYPVEVGYIKALA